jgi:AbrB family looped-hinge helix DNA binding protein
MRITSRGRVTIPAEIREKAGLLPNTEVDFVFDGEVVRLIRGGRKPGGLQRGRARRGGLKMTTEEIMALLRSE